jgi:hypothetical protein
MQQTMQNRRDKGAGEQSNGRPANCAGGLRDSDVIDDHDPMDKGALAVALQEIAPFCDPLPKPPQPTADLEPNAEDAEILAHGTVEESKGDIYRINLIGSPRTRPILARAGYPRIVNGWSYDVLAELDREKMKYRLLEGAQK